MEMQTSKQVVIATLQPQQVAQVARLHAEGISSGFISSLGPRFIQQLYRGIMSCSSAFCLVALEQGHVLGFLAGAESVGKLYRSVILRRGLLMIGPLLRFAFSPRTIRKIFQTLLYPSHTGKEYPPAEVLSVVVAADARRRGVGDKLMRAGLKELAHRNISAVKVAVAADNEPANHYYIKEGFEKAGIYDSHGVQTNIYVRQLSNA